MKQQIKILKASARSYMLMARLMRKANNKDSMISYYKEYKKCCKMISELEKQLIKNATNKLRLVS